MSWLGVVDAILAMYEPMAVILFGSYARGDAHQYSDIDLLIIRPRDFDVGESRRKELGRIYRAVSQTCEIPKDILLFTKREYLDWRHTTNHMAAAACKEGRILYGKIQ